MNASVFTENKEVDVSAHAYDDPRLSGGMLRLNFSADVLTVHADDANELITLGAAIERAGRELAGKIEAQRQADALPATDPFLPVPALIAADADA